MLIDSSLWSPFHQAKDTLFTALLNRCRDPPVHIFSAPPSQRHAIRTQANENISALLDLERELEVIQREFKQAYEMVSQQRAATESCLWPIGALPFDVIREIVLYTVEGGHDHRQILNLSHVSKQWREAVLSISWLFTEANWDGWSPLLIDTWCSRAGPHLLKVYLPRLHSLGGASGSSRFELLQKLSTQVGKLEVVVSSCLGGTVNRATNGLFELQMPSLQYLKVTSVTDEMPEFHLQNVPMLRVLELAKLDPRIPSSLTNVTRLRCRASLRVLKHRDNIFSGLPNLQHLALEIYGYAGSLIDGMGHPIVLSSLISLEVRWLSLQQPPDILSFFGSFLLPNLRSLVLHNVHRGGCIYLLQSLGQQVPGLRSIHFIDDYPTPLWPAILPAFIPTDSTAAIFPDLQEVEFLVRIDSKLECTIAHHRLLRDFGLARAGTLTRLSISPMQNMEILTSLRDYIPHLEVSKPYSPQLLFYSKLSNEQPH